MPKRVRKEADYFAKRPRGKRPHRIQYWRDGDGRWQYRIRAGNNWVVRNSIKSADKDPDPDHPNGYMTKRWALHKAKQALPRDATYVLEPVD